MPTFSAALLVTALGALALPAAAQDAFPTTPVPEQAADPALHALLPEAIRESGKMTLATDANYPPCQWFASDGTMVGYEVDIWNALAQVLGVTLDVSSIDFAGLIPGVQGGRYDVAMECITDRVEREEVVDFVNHSLTYGNAFYYLAANENITPGDPKSFCGLRTAGQSGTDFLTRLGALSEWCEKQGLKPIEIGEFPQQSAVLLALFSGRVDFALSESSAVDEIRANNPVDVATIPDPLEVQDYLGIVVAKENEPLKAALVGGLKELKANGAYDAIFAKWNLSHAALDDFGVNMTSTKPLR
jgi:polar amino acid transport system substrate-binding protein